MSERVVPTKPGWWWCQWCGCQTLCVEVSETSNEVGDKWLAVMDHDVADSDVDSELFTWIAPVPSAEAVQAAVEAMESMCDCEWLATEDRKMLNNAIAGLTGKGVV